jgi:hypothetical protein
MPDNEQCKANHRSLRLHTRRVEIALHLGSAAPATEHEEVRNGRNDWHDAHRGETL